MDKKEETNRHTYKLLLPESGRWFPKKGLVWCCAGGSKAMDLAGSDSPWSCRQHREQGGRMTKMSFCRC